MSKHHIQKPNIIQKQYENTHIIFIARDPHTLYAYWEIPVENRLAFIQEHGEEAWDNSVYVLKITNVTKNESTFVKTNDFSDNLYISSIDADSTYFCEIGRNLQNVFIPMGKSNNVTTPSETLNNADSANFFDYRKVQAGQLDMDNEVKIPSQEFDFYSDFLIGISSPEFSEVKVDDSVPEPSPKEKIRSAIARYLGISSENFIR